MRATYRVLAWLVPIIVALQAAFIALGTFGLGAWVEDGNSFTKSVLESDDSKVTGDIGFALHSWGANIMALIAIVLLVVSFFAKVPGGVRWAALIFVDTVLQWAFAFLGFLVSWQIGLLHGLNAFVLAGLGIMAIRAASATGTTTGTTTGVTSGTTSATTA